MASKYNGSIPPYVMDVVQELERETQCPVHIDVCDDLEVNSAFSMAGAGLHEHSVLISRECAPHMSHLVLTTAVHGLRVTRTPPEQRYTVLLPPTDGFPAEIPDTIRRYAPDLSTPRVERMAAECYFHVMWDLLDFPFSLRVESETWQAFPRHRSKQRDYLDGQTEALLSVTRQTRRDGPTGCYTDMNLALRTAFVVGGRRLAELPALDYASLPTDVRGIAGDLDTMLIDEVTAGHIADFRLCDRWAECLGISHWYEWDVEYR